MPAPESAPSIRRRLLLMLLASLSLLLALGVLVDYFNSAALVRAAYDQALAKETLAVAAHLHGDANEALSANLPLQAARALRADSDDRIYYLVLGPRGEFVAGDPDLPVAPAASENPSFRDAQFGGEAVRAATYRLTDAAGTAVITVAETLHKRTSGTRSIVSGIVLTDVIELAATLLLVWFGVRYGLHPLLALRDQIAARSARDLAPLLERNVPEEVLPLVLDLNRLLATVRGTAAAQQRFLADAAHQLRTPLAGIQGQLELLAQDPTAGELRERLQSLHVACRRLAHTANQLLTLARAEPAANRADDFEPVQLAALVEEAVATYLDRALERGIDLGADTAPACIDGSAWLLRELLANLIDNALAYAPPDGHVTVRCGIVDNAARHAFLEVEDDGPGIAPAERTQVLARFYRSPDSRGAGCGLGLAIVDDIARMHRAQLHIGAGEAERGTLVHVRFPVSAAA